MGKTKSGKNKCKCCGTSLSRDYQLVYDEEGKRKNIEFLLFDYIGKKLSETDGLDQAICKDCLKQLIQCHEFKRKCLEVNDQSSSEDDSDKNCEDNDEVDDQMENDDVVETNYYDVVVEENEITEMNIEYLEDDEEEKIGEY